MPKSNPKVALVADWIYGGGAEMVLLELHRLYPEAPIYTSYCSAEWRAKLDNKVVTGYLQHWPFSRLRKFLPLLRQRWFSRLDLSAYDLVISSSGNGEAKFVRAPGGVHVSYCHTPVHFYWRHYEEYLKNPGIKPAWLARLGLKRLVNYLRRRDYAAAQKVDYFVANSTHTRNDINLYYDRPSVAIFPPVNTDRFTHVVSKVERYGFVTWGRHVPMKRLDLAIQACNQLELPLAVIGTGPQTHSLQAIAGPHTTFLGRVSDEELARFANTRQAFIFPSFEDFGIAPVEAMAAGLPVIAYKAGGALDYVMPGHTGAFFEEQTVESLVATLKTFKISKVDRPAIQAQALAFSAANFQSKFKEFIASLPPKD